MGLERNTGNKVFAARLFFVFMLFPFASPYPIATDVQPLAGGLAFLLLLIGWVKKNTIGRMEVVGGSLCLISLFYFDLSDIADFNSGKVFALFLGFFSYMYIRKYMEYFPFLVFKRVVLIYFSLSIVFIISPDNFINFQSLFVRNSNVTELGYRGISTLSTEPGLFGGLLAGFFAINLYFYQKGEITKKQLYVFSFIILAMIIATKSGSGYMYLIVFFIVMVIKGQSFKSLISKAMILVVTLSVLIYLSNAALNFDKYGRGLHVFSKIINTPDLVLQDRSVMYRVNAMYVAILSFSDSPFGVGHTTVKSISQEIVDTNSDLSYFYNSYGEDFHPVSSFGFYLTAYGLFFLLPFMYIFIVSKATLENKVLSMIFFLFSYSIAFPIAWFLLSTSSNVSIRHTKPKPKGINNLSL